MLFQTFKLFKPFNLLLYPPPRTRGRNRGGDLNGA
jgi:hypothetical protein